jgi:hypothetical protein
MKEVRENGVLIDGVVVIGESFHRVMGKFVVCNPGFNRESWNNTKPKHICYRCFPLEEARADLNQIIEDAAQPDLFKE